MLDDRRVITDSEIYGLIEWKLKQRLVEEDGSTLMVCEDDKPIIQIRACGKLLREINKMRKENKEE